MYYGGTIYYEHEYFALSSSQFQDLNLLDRNNDLIYTISISSSTLELSKYDKDYFP